MVERLQLHGDLAADNAVSGQVHHHHHHHHQQQQQHTHRSLRSHRHTAVYALNEQDYLDQSLTSPRGTHKVRPGCTLSPGAIGALRAAAAAQHLPSSQRRSFAPGHLAAASSSSPTAHTSLKRQQQQWGQPADTARFSDQWCETQAQWHHRYAPRPQSSNGIGCGMEAHSNSCALLEQLVAACGLLLGDDGCVVQRAATQADEVLSAKQRTAAVHPGPESCLLGCNEASAWDRLCRLVQGVERVLEERGTQLAAQRTHAAARAAKEARKAEQVLRVLLP
jgi:hypothetical protein